MYKLLPILFFISISCLQKNDTELPRIKSDKYIHIYYANINDGDASFSYFTNLDEQYKLVGSLGKNQDIIWDSTFTFCLLTTAFNSTYPISNGDSISINFQQKKGYKLDIPNSRFNNFEINFFNFLSNSNNNIQDYYFRKLLQNPNHPVTGSVKETYYKSLFVLDSCLSKGVIKKEYFDWAKKVIEFEYKICNLNLNIINVTDTQKIIAGENDFINTFQGRKLLQYNLIKRDLKSNFSKVDFNLAYNFVLKNYKEKEKDYLLFFTTKQLIEKYSNKRELFITKFKNDVNDSTYLIYFEMNYSKSLVDNNKKSSIILIDKNRNEISYDSILAKNMGNILYIDNWASWCVPCRIEMPSNKNFFQLYKGKNVKIIYISIDEKMQDWINASKEMGINEYENSYLLKDPKTSSFTRQFKITEIPRYILLDKTNKVLNDNAPPASNKELKKIIDNNL